MAELFNFALVHDERYSETVEKLAPLSELSSFGVFGYSIPLKI
jgi:hypothetical protein